MVCNECKNKKGTGTYKCCIGLNTDCHWFEKKEDCKHTPTKK